MPSPVIMSAVIGLALGAAPFAAAFAQDLSKLPRKDRIEFFGSLASGAGVARKTRPVDARPATEGEIVVTAIAGEGVETRSKPAAKGDWVVRNRCAETGNEQYLVAASRFPARYGEPKSAAPLKANRATPPPPLRSAPSCAPRPFPARAASCPRRRPAAPRASGGNRPKLTFIG
jgi:hypothetical protein